MKKLSSKIDKLTNQIEMGFFTRVQAMQQIRILRSEILDKYEEGSDNFTMLISSLIDANEIANEI